MLTLMLIATCGSLAAGLQGNGERMRKWREVGNGQREEIGENE